MSRYPGDGLSSLKWTTITNDNRVISSPRHGDVVGTCGPGHRVVYMQYGTRGVCARNLMALARHMSGLVVHVS